MDYRLEVEEAPESDVKEVRLSATRSVSAESLRAGGRIPRTLGDIVWHYALFLPPSSKPSRGWAQFPADDAFATSEGSWRVRGEHSARARGKRAEVRSALTLRGEGVSGPDRGTLSIDRVFSLTKGRLLEATFSLEKAMDTAGVERLGRREWWRDAARELLSRQDPSGGWGDPIDTSFALLVLNRATLPARVDIDVSRGRVATGIAAAAAPWDRVHVEGVGQVSVRQVLQALERRSPRDAKKHLRLGKKALAVMEPSLRPRLLPELAALVDSKQRGVRTWARRECRRLVGDTDAESIRAAYERWEELYAVRQRRDLAGIPRAVALLREDDAPCVRSAALEALLGLRAYEALSALSSALSEGKASEQRAVWVTLRALGGDACPELDPAARASVRDRQVSQIKAWCAVVSGPLVKAERIRRAVADLGIPARARAAERTLLAAGRPAVRDLIDGLRGDDTRARAHDLLCEITGQSLEPRVGPWLDWAAGRGGG